MKDITVYISIAGAGENVVADFPYRFCLHSEGNPSEERLILKGENLSQIREGFIREGIPKLLERLRYFYQSFKEQRLSNIRYLIISPAYESLGAAITLELADSVRQFHYQVSQMPCEIEGFLLLPPLDVDTGRKALCYEFLTELDRKAPAPFDIVYLLDVNYMPDHALSETIRLYTDTDAYKSSHALGKDLLSRKFRNMPTAYSSLGISKLVFPKERWIELVGLKLLKDILLKSRLSPFTPSSEATMMAVSELNNFLEKTPLSAIIETTRSYNRLEGVEEAIRGLKEDTEDVNRIVDEFLDKIEYNAIQTTGRILERDDLKQQIGEFVKKLKGKIEEIIDTVPHSPFSALAFLTLFLDTDGVYTVVLRELEGKLDSLPPPVNLPGYLIGWIAGKPSENLKILFNEMATEIRRLYSAHFIPLPEIHSWEALWNELKRMSDSPQFENLLKSDTARFSELKDAAEIIKQSFEHPYTVPLAPEKLRRVLSVLEERSAGNIKQNIEEMRLLHDELKQVEAETKGLSWWKRYLPKTRALIRKREGIVRSLSNAKQGIEVEAKAVVEKVQRLLPCHAFLLVYQKLNEELKKLGDDVKGFTNALTVEVAIAEAGMNAIEFPSDAITHQIAHKDDIEALYCTNPTTRDIAGLFEKEFLSQLNPPKLSAFYESSIRGRFLTMLQAFAQSRFQYLKYWSTEQLMLYLNRAAECMTTLQTSCRPFIGIEKIKGVPELKLMECLYIGVEDEGKTKLNFQDLGLKGEVQFYSARETSQITGITLLHGFPVSLIESWIDWKNCHESLASL